MADTYTTNLNLTKPEPGAAEDTWGISLNADLDALDAIFSSSGTQINLNPNQINFADNKKAVFGTGSDLEIYHDGSDSYIDEVGTGNLLINANNVRLRDTSGNPYFLGNTGAEVRLYHNGSTKLQTTSTGIDVTGTVTSDQLVVDGNTSSQTYRSSRTDGDVYIQATTDTDFVKIGTQTKINILQVDGSGDISFYDDTGSTQGLFWDASAESLGIGTTSPSAKLDVSSATGSSSITPTELLISSSTQASDWSLTEPWGILGFYSADTSGGGAGSLAEISANMENTVGGFASLDFKLQNSAQSYAKTSWLTLKNSSSLATRQVLIEADGGLYVENNVGIGTASPATAIHAQSSTAEASRSLRLAYDGTYYFDLKQKGAGGIVYNAVNANAGGHRWELDGSEKARIDSSGAVLVGTTSIAPYASSSDTAQGIALRGDFGMIGASRPNNYALTLNRADSDGEIVNLRKSGSTVGRISSTSTGIALGTPLGSGSGIHLVSNAILPSTSTGGTADGSKDLGSSTSRFKDLHLSGTANFGSLSDGTITITGFVDEDNMSSDSATLLPTQQSVKAYVDANSFTINNNADNRIITGTANAGTLNAETTLTYGTTGADLHITGGSIGGVPPILRLEDVGSSGKLAELNHIAGTTTLISRNATSNGVIKFAGHNGTSETEYARIDSSGNVGINTSSPNYKLHVKESVTNAGAIFVEDGTSWLRVVPSLGGGGFNPIATAGDIGLIFSTDNASGTDTDGSLVIAPHSNNISGIKIRENGSVGIGTDSPSERFHVNSGTANTVAKFTSSDSKAFIVFTDNATSNFVATGAEGNNLVFYNGTERARIDSSGRFGIGISSPNFKLHLKDGTSTAVYQQFSNDTTGNTSSDGTVLGIDADGDFLINNQESKTIKLYTADTERMRIDSSGNVGIGETNLDAKLHLTATSAGLINQKFESAGSAAWRLGIPASQTYFAFDNANDNLSSPKVVIDSSGNVGIGLTAPSAKLQVTGNTLVSDDGANDFIEQSVSGNVSTLSLGNVDGTGGIVKWQYNRGTGKLSGFIGAGGSTEFMTVKGTGQVGIGTTNPQVELHVEDASGNCIVNIESATTGYSALNLGDTNNDDVGQIKYDNSNNSMQFTTNASEAMRLDSSGNLLVGTTDDSPFNNNAGSAADNGLALKENGQLQVAAYKDTANSGAVVYLNRTSTDGNIIDFRKNGSSVGSIGTSATDLFIGTGVAGLRFREAGPQLMPWNTTTNAANDNAIDIGKTDARFKDLYLSGTINSTKYDIHNEGGGSLYQTDGYIRFANGNTETVRIDSSGRLGVGTTSPEAKLHVQDNTTVIGNGSSGYATINFHSATTGSARYGSIRKNYDSPYDMRIRASNSTNSVPLIFETASNTEAMRIDSSGRLIVGGTTAGETGATTIYPNGNITSGSITATGDGVFNFFKTETYNPVLTANDSQSDTGQIIAVQIGGTTKGNIGISSATGNDIYIASGTTSSAGFGLRFIDYTVTNAALPCRGDGSTVDNLMDLGNSGSRFDDIYATNGTINTSDKNEKQDIQALTDAEQRVATACKGLIRRFRWQDSVAEKDDNSDSDLTARYHFGVMAQDLQDAFEAEGLDAGDYGMFISSTWTDDDGNEQTRLGVRYNELLAFIITTL